MGIKHNTNAHHALIVSTIVRHETCMYSVLDENYMVLWIICSCCVNKEIKPRDKNAIKAAVVYENMYV